MDRPLLMIPGPIEVTDAVMEAMQRPPPSHLAPQFIMSFGRVLAGLRHVVGADARSQPYVVPGGGTLAMEMAVCNVTAPGDRALVINTGYFSSRLAEMLRRRGVRVEELACPVGGVPAIHEIETALDRQRFSVLCATHVDTSTGVRIDPLPLAKLSQQHQTLLLLDGVCAIGAEEMWMEEWGVDVAVTGSQKALGIAPGLAISVFSSRAEKARQELRTPPPYSMDCDNWRPIMQAYEEGRPSYFGTPATGLVSALDASLQEIFGSQESPRRAMTARFAQHNKVAGAMRQAFAKLGVESLPAPSCAAHTLSCLKYPSGIGPELVGEIGGRGVIVAGGLHPEVKAQTFRVGHMGAVVYDEEPLARTISAVADALAALGHGCDKDAALTALREHLTDTAIEDNQVGG